MQASWLQERGRDGNMIEKMIQQGHHLLAEVVASDQSESRLEPVHCFAAKSLLYSK